MINNIIILTLFVTCVSIAFTFTTKKDDKNVLQNFDVKNTIYNLDINDINGKKIDLNEFRDKKILFTNIASKCGFTGQLKSLQQLHDKYKDDIIIIASPSNDFMNQEPLQGKEILNFCKLNYGVTFIVTEKIHVKGNKIHPLYAFLTDKKLNGWNNSKTSWNFNKFLINENGYLTHHFGSLVDPMSKKITSKISSSITS